MSPAALLDKNYCAPKLDETIWCQRINAHASVSTIGVHKIPRNSFGRINARSSNSPTKFPTVPGVALCVHNSQDVASLGVIIHDQGAPRGGAMRAPCGNPCGDGSHGLATWNQIVSSDGLVTWYQNVSPGGVGVNRSVVVVIPCKFAFGEREDHEQMLVAAGPLHLGFDVGNTKEVRMFDQLHPNERLVCANARQFVNGLGPLG